MLAPQVLDLQLDTLPFGKSLPGVLLVTGLTAAVLGFVIDRAPLGKRCPRCGRPATRYSVFCKEHRAELAKVGRSARDQRRHDDRIW